MEETNNETVNENNTNTSETLSGTVEEAETSKSAFSMESDRSGETASSSSPTYYSSPETNMTSTASYDYTVSEEPKPYSTGFAIASLVLGILSLLGCCCGIGSLFSILGIIFGCLQEKNEEGKKPGMAIAGIITSAVGLLFSILGIIYMILVRSAYLS